MPWEVPYPPLLTVTSLLNLSYLELCFISQWDVLTRFTMISERHISSCSDMLQTNDWSTNRWMDYLAQMLTGKRFPEKFSGCIHSGLKQWILSPQFPSRDVLAYVYTFHFQLMAINMWANHNQWFSYMYNRRHRKIRIPEKSHKNSNASVMCLSAM